MRNASRAAILWMILFAVMGVAQQPVTLDHPIRHIAGVVQRENGEPIPNIDVEVFGGRSLVATAKTDSKGKFKTDTLEPGEYEVWFTYKPHPVFHDVQFKVKIDAKGSKEPWIVVLKPLSAAPAE